MKDFKYLYGPVPSWRLGSSLGIDPLSQNAKICSFDCIYCQLGKISDYTSARKSYTPTQKIIEELKMLPEVHIDYITFSGRGEPTLAENLGQMIKAIKTIRKTPIAVLTNSSLMHREDVLKDLFLADFVIAKLDAPFQNIFEFVNRSIKAVKIDTIIRSIKDFRKGYTGKLALQIMFIEQNKRYAEEIAQIAWEIDPDEVQINTPLRPCRASPLSKQELNGIKQHFEGLSPISVYEASKKDVKPLSDKDTLLRRGKVG